MKKYILILIALLFLGLGAWWIIKTVQPSKKIVSSSNPDITLIKSLGVLNVGVDATFFPMEYIDEKGVIVGFGPDLAKIIAKELGVRLNLKNIVWDNIFDELDKNKIDLIISSVTITQERSKSMTFSKPYFNAGQVILTLAKDTTITNLASLKDMKVGLQSGTTSETEALKLTDKKNVFGYADYDVAITNLLTGKIDAIIVDYPVAVGKVKDNSNLKIVGGPFTQEFYGVVADKGKDGLIQAVNLVIEKLIDTGEMKKLENKWLK